MDKKDVTKRMQELGIYNDYYYRREIKGLPQLLKDDELLNCIFTGVNESNRKMVVITSRRIIIIFAPGIAPAQIESIGLGAVKEAVFEKKFPFSKVTITTKDQNLVFKNVQGSRKQLFEWALGRS